jgi:predicted ATPase
LYFEDDASAVSGLTQRLIAYATERELPAWRIAGMIFDGWGRVQSGDGANGIAEIREGLVLTETTGTLMPIMPLYKTIMVTACLSLGLVDEGLRTLDEAIATTDAELRAWHSDFHRLRGELLIIQNPSDHAAAEACFQEALAVARRQRAVGWELRAAMSLARLLRRSPRRDEARQALSAVYGRYAEGLNLAILRDAGNLLNELE